MAVKQSEGLVYPDGTPIKEKRGEVSVSYHFPKELDYAFTLNAKLDVETEKFTFFEIIEYMRSTRNGTKRFVATTRLDLFGFKNQRGYFPKRLYEGYSMDLNSYDRSSRTYKNYTLDYEVRRKNGSYFPANVKVTCHEEEFESEK